MPLQQEDRTWEEEFWRPGANVSAARGLAWVSDLKGPGRCAQVFVREVGRKMVVTRASPVPATQKVVLMPTYTTRSLGLPSTHSQPPALRVNVHPLDRDRSRCAASLHRSQKMLNSVDPRTQGTTQAQSLPPLPAASCISGLPAVSASSPALFSSILFLSFPISHSLSSLPPRAVGGNPPTPPL